MCKAFRATGRSGVKVNYIHRANAVNHSLGYLVIEYFIPLTSIYVSSHVINIVFDGVFHEFFNFISCLKVII